MTEASFFVACVSKRTGALSNAQVLTWLFGGRFRIFWCAFQTYATEKLASGVTENLRAIESQPSLFLLNHYQIQCIARLVLRGLFAVGRSPAQRGRFLRRYLLPQNKNRVRVRSLSEGGFTGCRKTSA